LVEPIRAALDAGNLGLLTRKNCKIDMQLVTVHKAQFPTDSKTAIKKKKKMKFICKRALAYSGSAAINPPMEL
jgi:hypothetical protein